MSTTDTSVPTVATHSAAFTRPPWARGTVAPDDAKFLREVVLESAATTGIEVGVASGCSSVVLLRALAEVARRLGAQPRLHAFDIRDRCYFAPEYPTGAWVAEHAPDLLPSYHLAIDNALAARRLVAPASVPFAFIDGCHLHPSAVLDFMALLPVLSPTAWVVLHDVRLGAHRTGYVRGFGPAHIVDAWPFEKRIGGGRGITVALHLPGDHEAVAALWEGILARGWETCPPVDMLSALDVPFQTMTVETEMLRVIDLALKKGRRLAVWGTGQAARTLVTRLRDMGVEPIALVDRTAASPVVHHLAVMRPSEIRRAAPRPLVAVTGKYRTVITRRLVAEGWRPRADFVIV